MKEEETMTYIFDFDGTLVDSMPVFSGKMLEIFRENNLPITDDTVKIITPLGYRGVAEYAIGLGMDSTVEDFIRKALSKMTQAYHYEIPAKAYVAEKLIALKAQGHSLNVLTASPHDVLDACLKRVGLYDLFDNVWSCDDFSRTKADPQIYVETARRLNTTVAECTFVDDNVGAVSTARQAGMYAVGVFDESSADYVEEMRAASDLYIMDFRGL